MALTGASRRTTLWNEPRSLARYQVIRLRTCDAVDRFLDDLKAPKDALL
jgi:hypothetical protein